MLDLPVAMPLPENRYDLHRMAYSLMLGSPDQKRNFIFAADPSLPGMVIRSAEMPEPLRQHCIQPVIPVAGRVYHFTLTTHPTINRHDGGRSMFPRNDAAGRLRWLRERAVDCGFTVMDASVSTEFHPVCKPGERGVLLDYSTFTGSIFVTSEADLNRALINGIGRAKSYGNGLMRLFEPN